MSDSTPTASTSGELFGKRGFCRKSTPSSSRNLAYAQASNGFKSPSSATESVRNHLTSQASCTLMFPGCLQVQRIFTSAEICFFQKQIWAVINKTIYILCYLHINLMKVGLISESQHKVPYFYWKNMGPAQGKRIGKRSWQGTSKPLDLASVAAKCHVLITGNHKTHPDAFGVSGFFSKKK